MAVTAVSYYIHKIVYLGGGVNGGGKIFGGSF